MYDWRGDIGHYFSTIFKQKPTGYCNLNVSGKTVDVRLKDHTLPTAKRIELLNLFSTFKVYFKRPDG